MARDIVSNPSDQEESTRWNIEKLGRVSRKDLLTEQKFYLYRRELLPRKLD